MYKFFYSLIVLSFLACNTNDTSKKIDKNDVLLAKVDNEQLYLSDIPLFQLNNLEFEDSVSFLKAYVQNWIKEEVIVQKAKENITNISTINRKAKQFKNDLLRAAYEKKVIESATVEISLKDLENYYKAHKEYFVFEENYYELQYILLPKNTSGIKQIRKNISENKPSAFITSYCNNNPEKCHLNKSVLKKESFVLNNLKLSKSALAKKSSYRYFYPTENTVLIYKINSKKNKGDIAPLEIVEKELSLMALENKKQEFLQDFEEKTFQKAKNDKIFENYIN